MPPTKAELYDRADELDIQGRSDMSKTELERAIAEEEDGTPATATSRGRRPLESSTGPKLAPPPPAGVAGPANPERPSDIGPTPNPSASRIGSKIEEARERREESLASSDNDAA